jgi:hypothetical protein
MLWEGLTICLGRCGDICGIHAIQGVVVQAFFFKRRQKVAVAWGALGSSPREPIPRGTKVRVHSRGATLCDCLLARRLHICCRRKHSRDFGHWYDRPDVVVETPMLLRHSLLKLVVNT